MNSLSGEEQRRRSTTMAPKPHSSMNPTHHQVAQSYAPVVRGMLQSPTGRMALAPPQPPAVRWPKELNMPLEQFWHVYFDRLFNTETVAPHIYYPLYFPDGRYEWRQLPWELIPVSDEPTPPGGETWKTRVDTAKVRFHCSNPACEKKGSGWTSVIGMIQFWWNIVPHLITGLPTGYVAFKLFGQKCGSNACQDFEPAMWYHAEVEKVLWNAFVAIRRDFDPNTPLDTFDGIRQRPTRPKKPHEQDNCEACATGYCPSLRSRETSCTSSMHCLEYQEQAAASPIEAPLPSAVADCHQ